MEQERNRRQRPPAHAQRRSVAAKRKKRKPKKSVLALISMILAWLYAIYLISHFSGAVTTTEGVEQAGAALATALVTPHIVCVFIGAIFNSLGYFMNRHAFVLVGAILYSVAIALFPLYAFFIVIQMILSYVAFAKMKKQAQAQMRPRRRRPDRYEYEEYDSFDEDF